MDNLYFIELLDHATPSFCTFFKPLWGRLEEIAKVAASDQKPASVPVRVFHHAAHTIHPYQWDHLNIWDCVYRMRCSKVDTEHDWVESKGGYARCMRAVFEHLEMEDEDDRWNSIQEDTWGIPNMLCFEGDLVRNRLAVCEAWFSTKQEMEQDYQDFLVHPTPIFTEFCNEIFGDG